MELLQLTYFCDAAQSENFSVTAKKFNVPPSNISQSIKRLEKELGVDLFTRRANRVMLNARGNSFYKKISYSLSLIAQAKKEITSENDNGEINLCINTNRRIIMYTIEKFKKEHPNIIVKTKFVSEPTAEEFDLIIANIDDRLSSFDRQKLLSENMAIAINCNNPKANEPNLNIAQLKDEPFITMNEQSNLYEQTQKICADYGFRPHIAVQSDDPYYVRRCVESDIGVAVVPMFSWAGQYADCVRLVKIDNYTRDTYIYTNPKKALSKCVKQFIEMLNKEFSNI